VPPEQVPQPSPAIGMLPPPGPFDTAANDENCFLAAWLRTVLIMAVSNVFDSPDSIISCRFSATYARRCRSSWLICFWISWRFFAPFGDLIVGGGGSLGGSAEGGYLIVTVPEFASALDPLVAWKRETGFEVTVGTTQQTGTTNEAIRDYIQTFYDGATVPPQYLLLVGDVEQIPGFDYHQSVSDLPYALLDGTDFFPDLTIGRLPVQTEAECIDVVGKIMTYDRTPDMGSWYRDFLSAGHFQDAVDLVRSGDGEAQDVGHLEAGQHERRNAEADHGRPPCRCPAILASSCAARVTWAGSLSRIRPTPSNSITSERAATSGISTSTNRVWAARPIRPRLRGDFANDMSGTYQARRIRKGGQF